MSSKTDLMYEVKYNTEFIPKRSPKVNIKTLLVEGKKTFIMKNHKTNMYYEIDEISYDTWNLIDGKRTATQINDRIQKKWPEYEQNTAMQVLLFLAQTGCLMSVLEPTPRPRLKFPSAFEVDVVLVENSKFFLNRIHKALRPLLKTPLLWIVITFIILCSALFAGQFTVIFGNPNNFKILGSTVVGFFFYSFIVLGPTIAIHEISHGLALTHYGGEPGEIGTGLFYFSPMFYIGATDAWTLGRRQRIIVMMAGNISTLLIASGIIAIGYIVPYPASISNILYMTAFFCFYMTLLNMAPPFETDGYYVLADLLNIPNLRQESYGYVKSVLKKALGMHVEKEKLMVRKKKILVGFAFLSVAWIAYTAFETALFTYYMVGDAEVALQTVYSAISVSRALSITAVVISIASILYFGMTLAGYGVVLVSAIKKALKVPLKFEAIHDRDLSMFFYMPANEDQIHKRFENHLKKIADKITQNHEMKQTGSMFTATLRMGGAELPLNQIGTHLRKIEQTFSSMYQDFLEENQKAIFSPAGIYGSAEIELEALLVSIGKEIADAGMHEAKTAIEEMLAKQSKTSMHLLNSVYGSVWTIELPPSLLYEVEETLLPTFLIEDFVITDLYGETEEFKKRTIYGFESLSRLSAQNRAYLRKALKNPEENQVVSCFEPIKSRLLFVGRTEQIERDIPAFGAFLVGQAWCGYLDNLLSETNLTLSALKLPPIIYRGNLQEIKDGELFVLNKNLSRLSICTRTIDDSLNQCDRLVSQIRNNIDAFRKYFVGNELFNIDSLNAVLELNKENLTRIPRRLKKFKEEFQRINDLIEELTKKMKKEKLDREQKHKNRRRKTMYIYPVFVALSAVLALAGFQFRTELIAISFLSCAILLQIIYWIFYYAKWRSLRKASHFPSHSFVSIQLFVLAFSQAIFRFAATHDIVTSAKEII